MKFFAITFGAIFIFMMSGCDANDSGCVADSECRGERTCQSGACTDQQSVIELNNLPGQNNGSNNNQNNGSNNQNNGTNNFNNGSNNVFNNGSNNIDNCGGCPGNATCEDGVCVEYCETNNDCPPDDACKSRFEARGNQCTEADFCVNENYQVAEFEFCDAFFSCDQDGFARIECAFIDDNVLSCFCATDFESTDFEADADACFDLDQLIDLLNQNCGSRIRNPAFIAG